MFNIYALCHDEKQPREAAVELISDLSFLIFKTIFIKLIPNLSADNKGFVAAKSASTGLGSCDTHLIVFIIIIMTLLTSKGGK